MGLLVGSVDLTYVGPSPALNALPILASRKSRRRA